MTQTANIAQKDQNAPHSPFRHWVYELWLDNCDEHLTYGEDPVTIKTYWDRYKYWLKREYTHQQKGKK